MRIGHGQIVATWSSFQISSSLASSLENWFEQSKLIIAAIKIRRRSDSLSKMRHNSKSGWLKGRHWLKQILNTLQISIMGFVLASCASNAGGYTKVSEVEARLKGMPKNEVASQLGAPTQALKISEDLEVWTYRTGSVGLTGGQCVISINFEKNSVIKTSINKSDYSPLAAPLGSCASIIGNLQ